MCFDLFLASTLFALGSIVFGHFEAKTPLPRRLAKLASFLGLTALVSWVLGQPWSLIWIFGVFGLGLGFHVWWTKKHGIGVFSGEPREKYYQLRGWD
jgi:hypothetical protein